MSIENGTKVRVHYVGTLDDGTEIDNSYEREEPVEFEVGSGKVIRGFDEAIRQMSVGQKLVVNISADNAYGPHFEEAVQHVPVDDLPPAVFVGAILRGMTEDGNPVAGTIVEMGEDMATVDFNHPLAGKDLIFEVELIEIVQD